MRFYMIILSIYALIATLMGVLLAVENHRLKNPPPEGPAVDYSKVQEVTLDDAPRLGPDEAPVKMVVFSEYECTFCQQSLSVIDQVTSEFGDKVQLVMKQFPLPMHPNARPAAAAALAAGEQGRFWEMHRLLFELQGELGEATYFEAAEHLELDLEQFAENSRPERWQDLIERDLAQGKKLGVRGTPTVFVNGVMMMGVDYTHLKEMVEKALE